MSLNPNTETQPCNCKEVTDNAVFQKVRLWTPSNSRLHLILGHRHMEIAIALSLLWRIATPAWSASGVAGS